MAKITLINPTINEAWNEENLQVYRAGARPGTELHVVCLEFGTASIEARVDDALAAPGVLQRAMEAEREGTSAVIVNCMNDPGVLAAREMVRIPVIGPLEASMHLAAMLSHRFSIITTGSSDIPAVEELVQRYHLRQKLASVRALDIPVLELLEDAQATLEAMTAATEAAVRQDGAGAIIPGCTLLAEITPQVVERLAARGIAVPVLNPPLVALHLAEMLIALRLSHSQRAYPPPNEKPIRWFAPHPAVSPVNSSSRET